MADHTCALQCTHSAAGTDSGKRHALGEFLVVRRAVGLKALQDAAVQPVERFLCIYCSITCFLGYFCKNIARS